MKRDRRRPHGPHARAERIVALAVRAYPRAFRDAYGSELARCVRDARRDLGNATLRSVTVFWLATAVDLGRQGIREWASVVAGGRDAASLGSRHHAYRAAGLALLVTAGANTTYDVVSAQDSMGILAALLTGLATAFGLVLVRPRGRRRLADRRGSD